MSTKKVKKITVIEGIKRMEDRLTFKQKLLYGLGDVFGGGGFTILSFLYTFYLTDIIGLNAFYVTPIVFVSNVWDAISDPLMGHITDQTKSKYGRRRPYFLYGPIAIIIAFTALWAPIDFNSQIAKFVYILFAYVLYNTVFTVVMVPYFAYGAEITRNYNERTKLGTVRLIISLTSSLIVVATPLTIVHLFNNIRMGYFAMSVVYGCLFAFSVLSVFFVGKEKKINVEKTKHKLQPIQSFKEALRVKSFRQLVLIFIIGSISIDTITLMMLYYVKYYIGVAESYSQLFLGVAMVTQIIFVPVWSKVALKKSKSTAYYYGSMIATVMLAILFFVPQGVNVYVYLVIVFFVCIGLSAIVFMPHTMFPDVTDVAELVYGKRMEGRLSGIQTFCRKCSKAIGLATITTILGLIGYQEASISGEFVQQSDSVIKGLKLIMTILPVVVVTIAGQIAKRYPINSENHRKLTQHLSFLNGEGEGVELSHEELQRMKETLI